MNIWKNHGSNISKEAVSVSLSDSFSPARHLQLEGPDDRCCFPFELNRIPEDDNQIRNTESIHRYFSGKINLGSIGSAVKSFNLGDVSTSKTECKITFRVLSRTWGRKIPAGLSEQQLWYRECCFCRCHNSIMIEQCPFKDMKSGWADHIELTCSTRLSIIYHIGKTSCNKYFLRDRTERAVPFPLSMRC